MVTLKLKGSAVAFILRYKVEVWLITSKKSTVIVKNPTHIAICLYYKLGETPLPLVIETGKDAKALQIIKLAELYDIPVIEDITLARSLYKNIHKGQYITEDFFEPVAQLIRIAIDLDY
ncbi:T3SS structure protein EscU [Escherichia coli]|nr:T3SS structure protein EscU [Escherichia coli]